MYFSFPNLEPQQEQKEDAADQDAQGYRTEPLQRGGGGETLRHLWKKFSNI